MQSNISFAGLSLTEIFQIQSLQSLLIKFWYLGLTSEIIIAKEDQPIFKPIKKTLNFANCFTFEMPFKSYVNYVERIMLTLEEIQPRKTFLVLLGHLRQNKITNITFELFGVALLQLFGKLLQIMDSEMMNKVLRKIYVQLTTIGKTGTSTMKLDVKTIKPIIFAQIIPNLQELLTERTISNSKLLNPQQNSLTYEQRQEYQHKDLRTLRGRLQSQRNFNSSLREAESDQYPIGEKMRSKERANLSCFMMGGFEIVDYSDSINQLHRKLLTKILLNK